MENPSLGKALSERPKLYRKHRAEPNFVAQLFDSEREFLTYAGFPPRACARRTRYQPLAAASRRAQAFCAIIAVRGSPGCASHTAGEPLRTSVQDLRRSTARSIHAQSLA